MYFIPFMHFTLIMSNTSFASILVRSFVLRIDKLYIIGNIGWGSVKLEVGRRYMLLWTVGVRKYLFWQMSIEGRMKRNEIIMRYFHYCFTLLSGWHPNQAMLPSSSTSCKLWFMRRFHILVSCPILSWCFLFSHVKHVHFAPTDDWDSSLFPEEIWMDLRDTVTPQYVDVSSEGVDSTVGL